MRGFVAYSLRQSRVEWRRVGGRETAIRRTGETEKGAEAGDHGGRWGCDFGEAVVVWWWFGGVFRKGEKMRKTRKKAAMDTHGRTRTNTDAICHRDLRTDRTDWANWAAETKNAKLRMGA
jgi:hypothetical protein